MLNMNNMNETLYKILIILTCFTVLYLGYRYLVAPEHPYTEGFTQHQPYVYKAGNEVYDDFYTFAYDNLFCNDKRSDNELFHIFESTHPSVNRSNILDMGCGTGYLVEKLNSQGYKAYGIDKNDSMCDLNDKNNQNAIVKKDDFLNPMAFDKGIFSHIVCTNFTLYEVENKTQMFANAHSWLKHNGYFIVHVIEPTKFDKTIPLTKPTLIMNPQKYQKIHKSHIDFNGFTYEAEYKINGKEMTLHEKFQDSENKNIRVNEHQYYLETPKAVENLALSLGFHLHSKTNMRHMNGDINQYIYIFEKSH